MKQVELSQVGLDDISELIRLNRMVQALHVAAHPELFLPASEATARAYFEQALADDQCHLRLAKLGGACVGYALSRHERRPATPFRRALDTLYLHQICVDPAHRRRGVGQALMQAVVEHARRVGAQGIGLDTWAFNREAQRFFARNGFATQRITMWRGC